MPIAPDTKALSDRQRRRGSWAVLLWLAVMLGVSFPYFEATRNANERPRLLQGMALVDAGEWAIDGPAARGLAPGPDVARSKADGRLYPNKPPGTSLVAAVGYVGARATSGDGADALDLRTYTWWARILGGLLPTLVLCAVALARFAARFGTGAGAGAVALYALSTPAASYAHLLYGHQLAAALLGIGIMMLVDAQPGRGSMRTAVIGAAGGGMACGAAVGVEYGAVFAAFPIAGLLLSRVRSSGGLPVLAAGVGGALVPIVLLALYHDAVFGSPWATGYHHVTNADFAAKHGQGLLGLGMPSLSGFTTHFVSTDGGLLWWAPTIVVAIYGLVQMATFDDALRTEARVHLALLVVYGVVVSSLSFEGGWRVGPRYLVVALPSLMMGWGHALSQLRTSWPMMGLMTLLATYAVLVNALAANLWPHPDLTNINQPIAEVLLPLWDHDREPYDLVRAITGRSGLRLIIYGSVIGTWAWLVMMGEGGLRMLAAMVVGGLAGLLLVQATGLVQPHSRGARNLAYIERIWEPNPDRPGSSVRLTMDLPTVAPP
ncbi:MAG: hypothetical protein K0V04_43610 [Deltaproteobacteria bacterium]|nr:hypothetical protein [Deltaproteobacteria bacterium]